ncbi:MAG TPA: tripartite tricarboxylate transporter TctB family protein, partial [Burkholderiales bacterium]|nr:tripartite tricarboxylate transporter TctB family protein [Burkholderiales bacterium]
MKIRSMKDFNAGLMFMGIGGLFAIGANQYPMGTAVRMGPAYFPSILGWGTVALGLFVFIES